MDVYKKDLVSRKVLKQLQNDSDSLYVLRDKIQGLMDLLEVDEFIEGDLVLKLLKQSMDKGEQDV